MTKTKYIDEVKCSIKEKYRKLRENSFLIRLMLEFNEDKLRLLEAEQKNLKAEVKILQSVYSYLKFKKDGCVRDGEAYFLQALSSIIIELKEHGFRGSVDHLMEEYFFTGKGSIIRELLSAGVRPSNIKKVIGEGDGMSNEDLSLLNKLVKIEEQRIERKRSNAVSNQNNR